MNEIHGGSGSVIYRAGSGTLIMLRGTRILLGHTLASAANAVYAALAAGSNPMAALSGLLADGGDHAVAVVGVTDSTTTSPKGQRQARSFYHTAVEDSFLTKLFNNFTIT